MRYFQPEKYQYVSQYTPDMMELDYKKGQDLLKQEEAFDTNLSDIKKNYTLSKGLYGSQRLVDEANNAIKSNLDSISADYNNNKITAREATNKLVNLSNYFNNDENIKTLKADKALLESEKALVATNKLNRDKSLNSYGAPVWSTRKDRLGEIDDMNQLKTMLPGLANTMDPGDPVEVAQKALKGILHEDYSQLPLNGNYSLDYETGPGGEKILVARDSTNGHKILEGINETKLKSSVEQLVKNSRNKTDQYWEWHNRNQSTDEDIAKELIGNYPGTWSKTVKDPNLKTTVIGDGNNAKGRGKKDQEDELKELAKTSITTVGNTLNFTDANGKELTIGNPVDLKKQVVANKNTLDQSVKTTADKLNTTYGQGLFTVNNDDNNHPYIEVDESKIPLDKKAVVLNEVITKNKQLKQQQIQQINNENILIRVEDSMRADAEALGKKFKLEDIQVTQEQKDLADKSVTNNFFQKYLPFISPNRSERGVIESMKFLNGGKNDFNSIVKQFDEIINTSKKSNVPTDIYEKAKDYYVKTYNKTLSEVNPEYAKYNKLLTDQLKGVQYKDQLLLTLDDKEESKSLKQVMQRTLDDKALRSKLVSDVTVNKNSARPNNVEDFWSAYDSDPDYKKVVEKAVHEGFARFDENTGQWATHITVPNKDSSKGNFELTIKMPQAQSILQDYGASHGYDYNFIAMTKRKDWIDSFNSNEAGYGLLKSNKFADADQDGNPDVEKDPQGNIIIDQKTGTAKLKQSNGLDIITQRITVPRTYKDSYGKNQTLQVGENIFELPGVENVIFKSNDTNGLFQFHALLDAAKASNDEVLYNQTLNTAASFGIDLINNPALYRDYNRQRRLNLDESTFNKQISKVEDAKQKELEQKIISIKQVIERKNKTNKGTVYTDTQLAEQLKEAEDNLKKYNSGK